MKYTNARMYQIFPSGWEGCPIWDTATLMRALEIFQRLAALKLYRECIK